MIVRWIIFILLFILTNSTAQKITPLGSGLTLSGSVYDIVVDESSGISYCVGDFSAIDQVKMQKVGQLSNDTWSAIEDTSKIEGVVFCAVFHEGILYVGGNFTIESGSKIVNLARLVEGKWQPLGVEFMSGSIRSISWFKGELYATGDFRSINGIKNNGVMKYSGGEWTDSGLNSQLNANEMFVVGDTLFAWGSGIYGNSDVSHTVSYYTNQSWTRLSGIGTSESCAYHKGKIYCTKGNVLYVYNKDDNSWINLGTGSTSTYEDILFVHNDELYVIFDQQEIYRIEDDLLVLYEIENSDRVFFKIINTIKSIDNSIVIGGDFQHWETHSVSLCRIDDNRISAVGKVSSHISHKGAWEYSNGNTIVEYNGKYLIGGIFDFADDIYSPNLVYWDGVDYLPFEVPLPDGVKQLEVFENELYALPRANNWSDPSLSNFGAIKFDGEKWVSGSLGGYEIEIIDDKLFMLNENGGDTYWGGPYYLRNGEVNELKPVPIEGQIPWYRYGDVRSYKDGLIMAINHFPEGDQIVYLASDTSNWVVLETIEEDFNYLQTINDHIFLIGLGSKIYEVKDGKVDTISQEIGTNLPVFFHLNNEIFYSAWNEETHRYNDNGTLVKYNDLRIRDVEKISENQYLAALQTSSFSAGLERVELNKICLITYDSLEVNINREVENICQEGYVQYNPITDHISLNHQWKFEGGTPAVAVNVYPMVKYNTPGIYDVTLISTNMDNDTVYTTSEIVIDQCDVPEPLSNNHDNNWIMGYKYGTGNGLGGFDFTFSDSIVAARYLSPVEMNNGSVVMSNENGNLQFYSNGFSIMNMDNRPMDGSECFNSELDYSIDYFIANQSLLSLPAVGKDSTYLIFDLDPVSFSSYWTGASNLSITTIDMSRNGGKGEVVSCNEVIIEDMLLNSTMQATRHQNGIDWWIIVGKYESEEYYKILISENGVESIETESWGRYYGSTFSGQSTFSPDGKYFAQVIREDQEVVIWKFDNQIGVLSDQQIYTIVPLDETEYPQGCSFSPDSHFLYVSSRSQMRQIDLCNYDEIDVEHIASWDGTSEFIYPLYFGKQMLAPNQQIIVTPTGNSHKSFGVIESPNEKGVKCNFRQHSLSISESTRNIADVIPVFPHYRNYLSYEGDCETVSAKELDAATFYVYPNPLGDGSMLHLSQSTTGYLHDVSGRKIHSFKNTDYLDVHSLRPGIYFINSEFGTHKFIRQ